VYFIVYSLTVCVFCFSHFISPYVALKISVMMYKVTLVAICVLGVASALKPLPLLGAAKELPVEDQIAKAIAHYAVSSHPGPTIRDGFFDTIEELLSTKRRVAGGELYIFEMKVKPSTCPLGDPIEYDSANCKVSPDAQESERKTCTANVHIRVWMKPSNTVTNWSCV